MKKVLLSVASVCFIALAGASSAATIDFENDENPDNAVYLQSSFQFTEINGGSISTPSNCGSECLLLQNINSGKVYKLEHISGLAFDLLSFSFNGTDIGGNPANFVPSDALFVSEAQNGGTLFTDTVNGNTMTPTGTLSDFLGVTALYFYSAGNGSARVDDLNINVSVAAVPLPATGLMMLAGLGAFGAMKRRKS